jgi:hypothetical protein
MGWNRIRRMDNHFQIGPREKQSQARAMHRATPNSCAGILTVSVVHCVSSAMFRFIDVASTTRPGIVSAKQIKNNVDVVVIPSITRLYAH